jgi:hypothetical protein
MVEIHLDEGNDFPIVELLADGLAKLTMSPAMPIDTALEMCGVELPEDVSKDFRSLFTARETQRKYLLLDGKLVIRAAMTGD